MPEEDPQSFTIGLVGPCTAGKSILRAKLEAHGYRVKHIAQEHSFVKDMWKRITKPDILVFLDVSYPTTLLRRKWDFRETDYQEQLHRLAHARQHADIYIHTDALTPDEVLNEVLKFLSGVLT
jgi:deoxyadenosine/deoxycytidine kinase